MRIIVQKEFVSEVSRRYGDSKDSTDTYSRLYSNDFWYSEFVEDEVSLIVSTQKPRGYHYLRLRLPVVRALLLDARCWKRVDLSKETNRNTNCCLELTIPGGTSKCFVVLALSQYG